MIRRLVAYVDSQMDFSNFLSEDQKLFVLQFPNTHQKWDGECVTHEPDTEQAYCDLFLYHSRNRSKCSPEFVFMHELGHVFQVRITKSSMKVPESFYCIAECIIPYIHFYDAVMVREIFADFFAMGMLTGSGFDKFDFYPISKDKKALMKAYFQTLASKLRIDINEVV